MTDMVKFNFRSNLSEKEIVKNEEESKSKDPKSFKPGTYELKIISAEFNKPLAGDTSWLSYKIRLGSDTRSIGSYVSVPTSGPFYNKPGMDPKNKMFMFHKFREFLKSLGEESSVESLNRVISKLFKDPSALVGKALKVDVGYKGPHSVYVEKGQYKIVDKSGTKDLSDQIFPDRDSAKAHAASLGMVLQDFPEVIKLHARPVEAKKEDKGWDEE